MKLVIHLIFMGALVLGGFRAALTRNRRGLLAGSALTTAGIMGTLWVTEISAATVLLAVVFIFFDFVIFAFSGATKLLPVAVVRSGSSHRIYATLVVWAASALVAMALYVVWSGELVTTASVKSDHGLLIKGVMEGLWNHQEFTLFLLIGLVFASAIGSFFMIEREK